MAAAALPRPSALEDRDRRLPEDDVQEGARFPLALGIGDRVLALGYRTDMPDVLAAADVVADLSCEGLGITGTLREAMAMGRPVVASAAGGNPELVEDGRSGLLVRRATRPPWLTRSTPARRSGAARRGSRAEGASASKAGFTAEVRLDRIGGLSIAGSSPRRARRSVRRSERRRQVTIGERRA